MGSVPPTPMLFTREQPRLWLASYNEASDIQWITNNRITHVVNLSERDKHLAHYPKSIRSFIIPVPDYENTHLYPFFDQVNNWIEKALSQNGNVLVHCISGKSRSVTIVVAFLM